MDLSSQRRWGRLALALCLLGSWLGLQGLRGEEWIRAFAFRSEALGRDVPYSVYLPRQPTPAGGWPMVLVLHGAGRNHRSLADDPIARAAILSRRLVLVFADGKLGWWLDSQADPDSRYASMLLELMDLARQDLPVSRSASHTGICGWSMGGYGAVRFAETYPREVSAVATALALLDFPNPALPSEQNHRVPAVFGETPNKWPGLNCMAEAERLRGHPLLLIAARQAFDYQMHLNFHRRLAELDIDHELQELAGGHTFPIVQEAWPQMLDFMEKHLGEKQVGR